MPPPRPPVPTPSPAVVLVHGLRTSSRIWDGQVRHLRAAGCRAVAVDLPAHGSRQGEDFTLAGALATIDDAVATFPTGSPVVLVGLSLGGHVCLAYAADPGRATLNGAQVAAVVAAACTASPRGKPVLAYRALAAATVSLFSRLHRPRAGSPVTGPPRVSDDVGHPPGTGPGWEVVTAALGEIAGRSTLRDVAAIRSPIWFVNGARDIMRLEETRHLARARDGHLVLVPRAGHDVNTDAPRAFDAVLDTVLTDLQDRAAHGHGARLDP
ncbi:hypothetical protein GCM10025865_03340 [Paraoerskovia sediminicola]|uniref:AB hydrolase-1 domain-containing protein n=1 Tax=Paraoerskovia sediminicola TaxID=1138587 RepID=A0ABN6X8C1_9CELL|nr:alpha/beta hydrolase [Paraoerskovia sediminicola]BDZ41035.1 hypothetical protein GCM10025865_03340 [Paraoerskovia sediminicola]